MFHDHAAQSYYQPTQRDKLASAIRTVVFCFAAGLMFGCFVIVLALTVAS